MLPDASLITVYTTNQALPQPFFESTYDSVHVPEKRVLGHVVVVVDGVDEVDDELVDECLARAERVGQHRDRAQADQNDASAVEDAVLDRIQI